MAMRTPAGEASATRNRRVWAGRLGRPGERCFHLRAYCWMQLGAATRAALEIPDVRGPCRGCSEVGIAGNRGWATQRTGTKAPK